jgi:hypothetical protein
VITKRHFRLSGHASIPLRRAIEERDAETLDLRDGKITRRVNLEAGDE